MLLREAITLENKAVSQGGTPLPLVCSFEPLHFKTFLQAYLSLRHPTEPYQVMSFGYDQFHVALEKTQTEFKHSSVLLFITWNDLHPSLSWRLRSDFSCLTEQAILDESKKLKNRLEDWMRHRPHAGTYIMTSPIAWLPLLDAGLPNSVGPKTLAAMTALQDVLSGLSKKGARILRMPEIHLNYRDLLQAGHPLLMEDSDLLAKQAVEAIFPIDERKKVIVLDLDDTLWSGLLGEGDEGHIECRSEGRGYPFYVFQKFLLKLKNEGILLAVCSKNNPQDVLPVFDTFQMPLKLADFSEIRCNWEPKSANILSIAKALNLSSEALVVVDDNPSELAEIQAHVPGVTLLTAPHNGKDWLPFMESLQRYVSTWRVGDEDHLRTESFAAERKRKDFVEHVPSLGKSPGLSYLKEMELQLELNWDAFSDPRSLELINKTNQFNLTGHRMSEDQWGARASIPNAFCLSAKLKDRFGNFGTIAILTGQLQKDRLALDQFVLSCRAFGRGVETLLLKAALEKNAACQWVEGPFQSTDKNEPVQRFLKSLGVPLKGGPWQIARQRVLIAGTEVLDQTQARIEWASRE